MQKQCLQFKTCSFPSNLVIQSNCRDFVSRVSIKNFQIVTNHSFANCVLFPASEWKVPFLLVRLEIQTLLSHYWQAIFLPTVSQKKLHSCRACRGGYGWKMFYFASFIKILIVQKFWKCDKFRFISWFSFCCKTTRLISTLKVSIEKSKFEKRGKELIWLKIPLFSSSRRNSNSKKTPKSAFSFD